MRRFIDHNIYNFYYINCDLMLFAKEFLHNQNIVIIKPDMFNEIDTI